MDNFIIRKYLPGDEKAIEEITYRTGFMGEDLTGKDYFNDQRLFYLIFIYYYPRYEPEHCYVAIEKDSNGVIGFICGTTDSRQQEIHFLCKMPSKIIFRIFTHTIWRDPGTIVTLIKLARIGQSLNSKESSDFKSKYPAHLHINILEEYQRRGLGMRLIQCFTEYLSKLRIKGVHLKTTSYNLKAIPFYLKAGFQIVDENPMTHPLYKDIKLLTFAKTIK
jgi:GNAT superfamily N-acetyltransferase